MGKIDRLDKKILYELDVNCRQSNAALGKKLRTSKEVINYRLHRLEEKKIIKGYRTIIDLSKCGYTIYRSYLKFQNMSESIEKEIFKYLNNSKEVWLIGSLAGRVDLVFAFWAKTQSEFYSFWVSFLSRFRKNIQWENISVILEYRHFRRAYLLDKKEDISEAVSIGSDSPVPFDSIDWTILSKMSKNARISLLQLAKECKLTSMAIKHRISNLKKKGFIKGFSVLLDFSKLDYEYYKVDMILEDVSKKSILQSYIQHLPNSVYIEGSIGASDLEFDFEVKNLKEFMGIMQSIKEKFPGVIRNFEYFSVLKIHKTLYFPARMN